MSSVCAHHEKELKEYFVRVSELPLPVVPKMSVTILRTDLAELTRPIGENTGKTGVRQIGVSGVAGAVEAAAERPAAIHAVLGGGIQPERMLGLKDIQRRKLVAIAPEQFCAEKEGVVNRAAERLPAKCCVSAVNIGGEVFRIKCGANSGIVVTAGVRNAEIDVGLFGQVAIGAQMADDANVLPAVRTENIAGIAPKDLSRSFGKPIFRRGQEARERDSRVVNSVFASDEVVRHQRAIDVRKSVVVNRIYFAEFSTHLADLHQQTGRERGEGEIALLNVHAFFAK